MQSFRARPTPPESQSKDLASKVSRRSAGTLTAEKGWAAGTASIPSQGGGGFLPHRGKGTREGFNARTLGTKRERAAWEETDSDYWLHGSS